MGKVPEPFTVLQTKRFSAVAYGPVLALFAGHSFLHGTDARPRLADTSRAGSSAARLTWHLKSLQGCLSEFLVNANRIIRHDPSVATPAQVERSFLRPDELRGGRCRFRTCDPRLVRAFGKASKIRH